MGTTINMIQNPDGIYSQAPHDVNGEIGALVQYGNKLQNEIDDLTNGVMVATNSLNQATRNFENANQRYRMAENNRQSIVNNEINKYSALLNAQNNLLNRINFPEIKIWREEDKIYYRTQSSQLIIDNPIEIQKELSSRYGTNVCIINDLNEVSKMQNQIKISTTFIAMNCLVVVEERIFVTNITYELVETRFAGYNQWGQVVYSSLWKRNLLAQTRFMKGRVNHYLRHQSTIIKNLVSCIGVYQSDIISPWINNIDSNRHDTILLLVGNQKLSEDLIINRIIKRLFDTGITITLTDEMLQKQTFQEIVNDKLFLHINYIPQDSQNQEKLKELLITVMINRSIESNQRTIPTQVKVIVTIDEIDPFLKDLMEITTTLFVNTEENLFRNLNYRSMPALYQSIEASLESYSNEISDITFSPYENNDNQEYLNRLNEVAVESSASNNCLPILDPFSDNFEKIISNANRFKHTYIIANQGFGKSQTMISLIYRDYLLNNCSVVLLDPHGDLADDVLKIIPDKERLVYIDLYFDDSSMPTINLFDIVDCNNEENINQVTQIIMSILKNISSEEKYNGLMENVAENCISVMLREGGGSLLEFFYFLDGTGSKEWVKLGKNSPNLIEADFFNRGFEEAYQTRMAIRRRLSKLIRDPKFSAFMNGASTLNLEKLVNTKGKIIVINIASGRMANTYQYYMKFFVSYLQLIALKRVSIPVEERVPTQLYLDEFHLFLDNSKNLQEILTGARKYKMFMTFAHQSIAQIEKSNLREIVTTIPTRYLIGNIANKSVDIISKALNTKLENPESLEKGQFYFQEDSIVPFLIQNTDRFLDGKMNISKQKLEEHKQYQLNKYYRPLVLSTTAVKPTDDELKQMIQKFKDDLKTKNLDESSCLRKLRRTARDKFKEIISDWNNTNEKTPKGRIRQQEISTIFQLAFELTEQIPNEKFTDTLKNKSANDMFNQTKSGTRLKIFADNGKSKTEQYYYFE